MLEKIASSILSKYLGEYVDGLDKENLSISVTAGDVVLSNLRLKKSALQNLELPIEVKEGFLTKLTLNIPWKSIGSKPAIVRIKGVYLVACPKSRSKNNAEDETKRKLNSKLQQLQLAETLGFDTVSDDPKKKSDKNDGFFARIIMKVVDNLQIYIDDIHIRYEDNASNRRNPICFGITLDSLHMQSTDQDWKPTFLNVGESIIHKLVTLSNFAVYLNTVPQNNQFISAKNIDELISSMKALIPKKDDSTNHHYILKPISGVLKATIDRGDELVMERPKVKISSELESFVFSLNANQFRSVMDIVDYVTKYFRALNFAEFRPPSNIRPKDNPRRWWKYLIDCALIDKRKKAESWKWENIQDHINNRQVYIDLFKKRQKLGVEKMSVPDKKRLEELEVKLEYEDIITFRKLANASLKKEQEKEKNSGGFFTKLFGGKNKDPVQTEQEKESALKELYEAIEYKENSETTKTVYPKEYVKILVDFNMKLGSIELRQDDISSVQPLFTCFNYHELSLNLLLRENSTTLTGKLGSVEMIDYHTLSNSPLVIAKPDTRSIASNSETFMSVQFDINPIDTEQNLDFRLCLSSRPLVLTFSRPFVDRTIDFFKTDSKESVQRLTNVATAGLDQLKTQAENGLKFTLQEKKKIKVDINLEAPKIIIPSKFDDPHCPTLVLDLGNISFWSDPFANESSVERSGKDVRVANDFFYDTYLFEMKGLHALLISGEKTSWHSIFSFDHSLYSFIRPFDMTFKLMLCNEDTPELPKVKILGNLQELSLELTQPRIILLVNIISSIAQTADIDVPKFDPSSRKLFNKGPMAKKISLVKDTKSRARIHTPKVRNDPYGIMMEVDFNLNYLSINMFAAKTIEKSPTSNMLPLVNFALKSIGLRLRQANHETIADILLNQIRIDDIGYPDHPILSCLNNGNDLVIIKFVSTPKNSPLYKNIDNKLDVSVGHVLFNINRPTIAALLQTVDQLNRDIQKNSTSNNVMTPQPEEEKSDEMISSPDDSSVFVLHATLSSLKVNLNLEGKEMTSFFLNKSSISLDVKADSNLIVGGYLGSIMLYYLNAAECWRKVVSVDNAERIVSFKFIQFSKLSKDYSGHDMYLDLQIHSLKAVFLNKTIKELTDYFAAFDKMRQLISAATYYYYSVSLDAIQEAARNITLVKFNIKVDRPQIVIPTDSQGVEHLVLDLGNIAISNSFEKKNEQTVDNIFIAVNNLNAKTHSLENGSGSFVDIINDTQMSVSIARSTDPSKSHPDVPDIEVSATIPSFAVILRETQLSLLCTILSNNINEPSSLAKDPEIKYVIDALTNINYDLEWWKLEESNKPKVEVGLALKKTLMLSFEISEIIFIALRGNGFDTSSGMSTELIEMDISRLECNLDYYNNSTLSLDTSLKHVILKDVRKETCLQFKRIWAPIDESYSTEPQFHFTYKNIPCDNMTTIGVGLNNPLLTLAPETLTEVYTFIMRNVAMMGIIFSKAHIDENPTPVKTESTYDLSHVMKIQISLNSPEICVIENPNKESDSSLILHLGNITVNMSQSQGQMKLGFRLDDLDIFRCMLHSNDLSSRKDVTKLLQPMSVEANLGMNDEGAKRLSVDIGVITTIVSFADIKRFLTIYNSFSPFIQVLSQAQEDVENISKSECVEAGLENESTNKLETIDHEDSSLIPLDEPTDEEGVVIQGKLNMMIIVSLKAVLLSLLNDRLYSHPIPVLKLSLENNEGMISFYEDASSEIYYSVETLEMNSYNNKATAIEPVIEPWSLNLHYQQSKSTNILHVEAQEVFDINITKSLLDALFSINDLIKEISDHLPSRNTKRVAEKSTTLTFDPYIIRNYLSNNIRYALSDRRDQWYGVSAGQSASVKKTSVDRKKAAEKPTRYSIDIELQDEIPGILIPNIPISKVNKFSFLASRIDPSKSIIVDVEESNGTKYITLRSNTTILNNTTQDIEISIIHPDQSIDHLSSVIKHGETFNIPISYVQCRQVCFRPVNTKVEWFKWDQDANDTVLSCSGLKSGTIWLCQLRKHIERISGEFVALDTTISLDPLFKIENNLCSPVSMRLVNKSDNSVAFEELDLPEFETIYIYEIFYPHQLADKKEHLKMLSASPMAMLSVSISIKQFDWSDNIPLKKDSKKLKIPLFDRLSRQLLLFTDIEEDESSTKVFSIYSEYLIINNSGLNLFYKSGRKNEEEAAGQCYPSNEHRSLLEKSQDPLDWYKEDADKITEYGYNKNRLYYHANRLSLRVEDSTWSKDFPLGVKNEGVISIQDKNSGREYAFTLSVEPGPGKLWKSKIVTIRPAFILVNKTSRTILYKQHTEKNCYELPQGLSIPFHWSNFKEEVKKIAISEKSNETAWSPDISVYEAGSFKTKLRNALSRGTTTIDVIIKNIKGISYVIFGDGTQDIIKVISYKIVNRTDHDVSIQQLGSQTWSIVSAGTEDFYCWDDPQAEDLKLTVYLSDMGKKHSLDVELDVIAKYPDIPYLNGPNGSAYALEVKAEGDVKTLEIYNIKDQTSEALLPPRHLEFQLKVSMRGIGISVIDDTPQELLYMTLQTIFLDFQMSNVDKTLEFSIGLAQIDNQIYNTQLPILLYYMPIEDSCFFHFSMIQDSTTQKVQFFKYLGVRLGEIDLMVDEALVIRLLAFFENFFDYMYTLDQEEKLGALHNNTGTSFPLIDDESIASTDIYYFEMFHINPVRANITYMANPEAENVVLKADAIQKILGYIGKLTNIERAPIELNCLILEHPYCSIQDLIGSISKHYTLAAIKQAYLILGSSDFIGNPVSLVSNLGTGVRDFFYEPAKGIVKSPKDFGKGLAKGTTSLIKKSIYGLFDTTSKLTGTVAKVGATLTLDSEYQKERSIRNQVKARHVGEGFVYGVRDLSLGVFKGITGVVVQPIKGVKKEGALGFFKGIGKGLTGIVLKPAIGAVDLITRATEGIKNTTTFFDEKSKVPIRPPRFIPEDKTVVIYNFEKSIGKQILKSLESEEVKSEAYFNHVLLLNGDCLMITTKSIVLIEQSIIRLGYKWTIEWKENISSVTHLGISNSGRSITIEAENAKSEMNTRTINCSNIEEARLVYQKLLSSGAKFVVTDLTEREIIEKTLGDDVFDLEESDFDIDDSDMKALKTKRQKQRQQKYANERTKLLGEGEKSGCCECCECCSSSCTMF